MSKQDWRGMDRATRSAAYDNGAAVADSGDRIAAWRARSVAVRAHPRSRLDLVYGPRPRNRIDLFTCDTLSAPLVIFVHGGYWQRNAKEDFACIATGPLGRGCDVALLGYTLAPAATLTEIAAEIRAATMVLKRLDAEAGVARPFLVSGWSAGGHLAALSLDWPEVDAVLAISGIFDLVPLRGTTIDDALALTDIEIADLSPIRRPPRGRMAVAYGAVELPELRRQSLDYHAIRVREGAASTLIAVDDADHLSILDGLIDPAGALTGAILDLLSASR